MVNKVIFHGRMVRDAELKDVNGFKVTEFTIAWSEKYKETETRCFLRCKAWRSTAEFIEKYFKKGQEICIEGRMVTEEWEKEGEKQSRTICTVEKVHFCGSKASNNESTKNNDFVNVPENVSEEIPFE